MSTAADRPRVFLAMPRYGLVAPEAMIGKIVASTASAPEEDQVAIVSHGDCSSSLLPHSFNIMLAEALDMRDRGQITHFAMIHSDIAPRGYWLNELWRIMRTRGDDLVSAVVPIKDQIPGRTSTAISDRKNPWAIKRFVTLRDRLTLPETFSRLEVCNPGEVLLVNTGLWLADLRRPYWNDFAFSFHTRITRDESTGKRTAWVRPEDWELSRKLDAAGAPYSATWAVQLRHLGHYWWDSHAVPPLDDQETSHADHLREADQRDEERRPAA